MRTIAVLMLVLAAATGAETDDALPFLNNGKSRDAIVDIMHRVAGKSETR
jgi:hypothetical protein